MTDRLLPTTRRGWLIVVLLLGLALLLRVGVVLENRTEYTPLTDAFHFDLIATSIADGDGFLEAIIPPMEGESAIRAPLYPYVLGGVYVVFGEHSYTAGRLANAVVGVAAVALIGLVAAQLWSRRVAVIAMALAAVHPAMILVGSGLQLEVLLVALSMATLAAALQHRRTPRGLLWPIVAGVLLGLSMLTREVALALLLPLAYLFWKERAASTARLSWQALAAPVAFAAAMVAVIAPWTIRNAIVLDAFVPITTSAGYGLAGMYNETSLHNDDEPALWIQPHEDPGMREVILEHPHPTEVELDGALRDAALDVIKDNPTYPFKAAVWNTIRMFDFDGGDYSRFIAQFLPYSIKLTKAAVAASYVVLALAAVGALRRQAREVPFAIWAIPIITYVGIVFFLPGSIRYRASIEPYLVLLASVGLLPVLDRVTARFGAGQPAADGAPTTV